jgi:uncharacterized protein
MKKYSEMYVSFIINYRWFVIATMFILAALSISGASRLSINTDLRIFFSEENPQLMAFEALENTYSKNDNIFIAISNDKDSVFNRETLSAIEELTREAWKIPYSQRVNSITNFQHSYANGDELIVSDLVRHANNLTQSQIENVKNISLSEPLLINRLISPSGKVTGINIDVIKPNDSSSASPEIVSYVRSLIEEYKVKYPQLGFHITGWVMLDNTMGEGAQRDVQQLIPVMLLVLILVMGWLLKSFRGTIATVVIIMLSMLTGMGIAGWMSMQITGPSSTAPSIILTLALADSIHILLTIFQRMNDGDNRSQAIKESLMLNFKPVLITSATTLLGFLAMNFSDAPPFRDLGNIVAVGIAAAFMYSVTLLPALMAVILPETAKSRDLNKPKSLYMSKFSGFVISNSNRIFWSTMFISILITLGALKIELNDDFIRYFDESYTYRVDSEYVMDNLTGLYTIEYSLESGKSKGIHDPKFLKEVEKFESWYITQPEVMHVNSFIPIIKKLNKNMHGDDPEYYRIPSDQTQIAQYILLYEMSLPFGQDLNNQINVDKSSLRFIVSLKDVTANDVREIDDRARHWMKLNSPDSMYTYGTGLAVMYAHLSERNIKSMLLSTFSALILISLILMLTFRSIKFGIMSLLPNLMPAIMAFGVWGLTMERIGIPASVLVSLAMGIVVDDTVHFISKYLNARRSKGMIPVDAIHYAFDTVGKALLITTITLVLGFSVLSLSGYKPNYDMGIMTGIIISLALFFDFLLLPTLILKLDKYNVLTTVKQGV